jgi:hypothetical protein
MARHLAGIMLLANFQDNFGFLYHSCMLPIDERFTLIKKSVFECAMAGCASIWIVANDDLAPIVKHHIGEWVYDPVYYTYDVVRGRHSERRITIPIYYVPILPKDRNRRDSYGWSALFGMHSAWWVSYRISKWAIPKKYFISFPSGIYDFWGIRQNRLKIAKTEQNFFFCSEGKTIKDNLPIAFSMRGEDFIQCRRNVNKLTTKTNGPLKEGETWMDLKPLPFEERWSARYFDLSTVFDKVLETNAYYEELDWFYDARTWNGYRNYLSSGHELNSPDDKLIKAHTLEPLFGGYEEE